MPWKRYVLNNAGPAKGCKISCWSVKRAAEKRIDELTPDPLQLSFVQLFAAMRSSQQSHIAFCYRCYETFARFSEQVELASVINWRN